MREERVGEKHKSNSGEYFTIIDYRSNKDLDIQFEDGTIIEKRGYYDIIKGKIKNPNTPSIYSIGYMGQGKYSASENGKRTKEYSYWKAMLSRCNSDKFLEKCPSYKDVMVCQEWKCFQSFAKWYKENWKDYMDRWCLDKDILIKGNKIYSPETCCFVPTEVNNLVIKNGNKRGEYPIGVSEYFYKFTARTNGSGYAGIYDTPEEAFQAYKTAKETHIKETIYKWKGKLSEQAYNTLYNYVVEITD